MQPHIIRITIVFKVSHMNASSLNESHEHCIMTLSGNGQVSAIPDLAVIQLGVQTTGFNLTEVQAENARISQAVLQAIRQLGVTEIRTSQYLIDKNYSYENGNRIDNGYSVRNLFEIRTEDLGQAGAILDTAVENGANMVEFVNFEVSDSDYFYMQALDQAMGNAIQKAQSLARYLGIAIDPIPVRITETSTLQPFPARIGTFREGVATPVEPGRYTIQASLTAEFRY